MRNGETGVRTLSNPIILTTMVLLITNSAPLEKCGGDISVDWQILSIR